MRMIKAQMEEAGTNYFVGQFAFGDLTLTEVLRTVDLFTARSCPSSMMREDQTQAFLPCKARSQLIHLLGKSSHSPALRPYLAAASH